ncbi:SHOCT domain-containing protein [Lactobacillus sp. 3B(2020)]|uniref:SHOCT domain-containing protein n=1 Tax=Lactobacillus sp. 3B(2020) TaxID=2695882 RepID=UPI002104DED6|nr:SHOCT domain-containing protein [Lactobacillus sp. 3B(2020)]
MSKVCIICGTKQNFKNAMTLPFYSTSDHRYICGHCLPKIFPDVKVKDTKLQVFVTHSQTAKDWLFKHTSVEAKYYYDHGKQLTYSGFDSVEGEEFICPYCASHDVSPISEDKKAFSFGKAVGGALLTGGVGALAGFAGKKTGKLVWVCNNCHSKFTAYGNPNQSTQGDADEQNKNDAAEEIMKYKNLLDNGAITQEEFEAKKKQLLKL